MMCLENIKLNDSKLAKYLLEDKTCQTCFWFNYDGKPISIYCLRLAEIENDETFQKFIQSDHVCKYWHVWEEIPDNIIDVIHDTVPSVITTFKERKQIEDILNDNV